MFASKLFKTVRKLGKLGCRSGLCSQPVLGPRLLQRTWKAVMVQKPCKLIESFVL